MKKENLFFLVIPVSQILMLSSALAEGRSLDFWGYGGILLSIAADLLLFHVLIWGARKERVKKELRELTKLQEAERRQNELLEVKQKELLTMRSDFEKRLVEIQEKLERGERQDARKEMDAFQERLERTRPAVYCQNMIVNALLAEKEKEFARFHIQTEISLLVPRRLELNLEGVEIINLRHDNEAARRERYARLLAEKRAREGATYDEACDKMFEPNYFGMMMVETGDADAFITGTYTKYSNTIKVAKEVIGIRPGLEHFGTMHIVNSKKGTYFLADTLINRHPDTKALIDIALLADHTVKFFNHEPVMAMVSYSNFGADTEGSPKTVHQAVDYIQSKYPEILIDGEMQVNFALDDQLRDRKFPFNKLKGRIVNTLLFPNLSSANSAYKLIQAMSDAEMIGPIQMGLNKPIHFTDIESSVRDIVNITAVAVIDAIVAKKMENGDC